MSKFEWISIIISFVALAQPWIIKLWNSFFRKLKITFIPSGKMKLFYNRSGAYIQIGGVVEAKNQSATVKDISAKVTRCCDNAELKLNWCSFSVPSFQNIAGNIVTTTETARPFKVESNGLYPVFVEFCNADDIFLNNLSELHNRLIMKARSIPTSQMSLDDAQRIFRETSEYRTAKESLLESFYIVAYKNATLCSRLTTQNYTTIISLGYAPLIEYVHENLPLYIDNIVLGGANRNENINQIIDLIKRSISDTKRCERIIQFEEFCLSNISLCCSDQYSERKADLELIWNALLKHSRVEPTWENVDGYWYHFGLTAELTEFIAINVDILEGKSSTCLDDALRQEIIQSDIKPPIFTKLLKHLHLANFDIPIKNIHEVNVEVMIKSHYFNFSADMYTELSESYPALSEAYILENKDAFLAEAATVSLEKDIFERLIISKWTDNAFKESIIKTHGVKLMSQTVAEYICSKSLSITKEVFDAAWDVLAVEKKKQLMIDHLSLLKAADLEMCFSALGEPYQEFTDRSRRHNVTLPDSEGHRALVKRLQKVDYITSYDDTSCVKEYDKKLRKLVDRPAILCRVKALN